MQTNLVYAFDSANEIEGIGNTIELLFMSLKENESKHGNYYTHRITQSLYEIRQHLNRIADELRTSYIVSEVEMPQDAEETAN